MNKNIALPSRRTPDVWDRMKDLGIPLYMYGTGNGADRIINVMNERGISLSGVFASDGFVRSRVFRGFPVRSYSDICAECAEFAVVVAFGSSRPEVMENVERIASEQTVFCPDVPAVGNTLFDSDFYDAHFDDFRAISSLFADERSREVYSDIINYKLTGSMSYLASSATTGDPGLGILRYEKYVTMLDLGAYTGDTVKRAIEDMPHLERVIAVEPETRAFKKLSFLAETSSHPVITAVNAAAWDTDSVLTFTGGVGRGSTADADGRLPHRGQRSFEVAAITPDTAASGVAVDYVKYDVEGAEARALRGSARIISEHAPDLLVSLYHRSEDIIELPKLVHELCPNHKLYLRRAVGFPAWDINLYAVR